MPWRALTPAELDAYDVLPLHLARRVRLVRVPVLPRRHAGMALGRFVLLTRAAPPHQVSALVAHELVHVRQWAELGVVRFLARYLGEFATGATRHRRWAPAYRAISLEVAARDEARAWSERVRPGPGAGGEASSQHRGPSSGARLGADGPSSATTMAALRRPSGGQGGEALP